MHFLCQGMIFWYSLHRWAAKSQMSVSIRTVSSDRALTSRTHKVKMMKVNPLYSNVFSYIDKWNLDGIVHYIFQGVKVRNAQIMIWSRVIWHQQNVSNLWHFIRVFTFCKSTHLGVSRIQRVKVQIGPLAPLDSKICMSLLIRDKYQHVMNWYKCCH